jgi:hypothetical protein
MSIPPLQTTRQVFPPVNCCIYCGAVDVELTTEHIIPFSLDGIMELPKSSCKPCAKITHTFEHTCARQLFGKFRIKHNLRTRRKRERPKELTAYATVNPNKPGQFTKTVNLPAKEYPTELFLYKFKMAGALLGAPANVNTLEWVPVGVANHDEMAEFEKEHGGRFTTRTKMVPIELGRMLAKIGHSFAVANLGLHAFSPLALDVILCRTDNISYVVGGSWDLEPPVPGADHLVSLEYRVEPLIRRSLVVAHIRLFANIQTPSYHVVVGRIQNERHVRTLFEQMQKAETIEIPLPPGMSLPGKTGGV